MRGGGGIGCVLNMKRFISLLPQMLLIYLWLRLLCQSEERKKKKVEIIVVNTPLYARGFCELDICVYTL